MDPIAMPGPARLKVIDPLLTMGPSAAAEVLSASQSVLRIRVPRRVLAGSKVQIRTEQRILFGEVLSAAAMPAGFEIVVDVQR